MLLVKTPTAAVKCSTPLRWRARPPARKIHSGGDDTVGRGSGEAKNKQTFKNY